MHRVKLGNLIGSGRQGQVYLGYHRVWNEEIAVKKFYSPIIAKLEATALEACVCPQIPRFYELVEDNDASYIFMEHVQGASCEYLIEMASCGIYITENEIQHIIRDVSIALQHLHKKNILYGDIKPSNVMFVPPDKAKLIDLGCARIGFEFSKPLGTPLFFSPEKFAWTYSFPSDIWSLGVFMYMLSCGIHPFVHRPERLTDIYELEHEILITPLCFHHPRWDIMSKDAKNLLENMLQKDEQSRYTIEDVLKHPWIANAPERPGKSIRGK